MVGRVCRKLVLATGAMEQFLTNVTVNRRELTFKALAGLAGGAIGWIPVELASHNHSLIQPMTEWEKAFSYASMAILAGLIGGLVLASDEQRLEVTPAVRNRFVRGFVVCALLVLPANYYANSVFTGIMSYGGWGVGHQGSFFFLMLGRVVSWTMMGAMLGAGVGLASLRATNILKGLLGGWVGGSAGGFLFDPINLATGGGLLSRLVGLSLIGLAIGLLIGLVQELTKTAWLTVVAGRLRGRQFRLEGNRWAIGRAEENPVGLFGDPAVEMRHAMIERQGADYVLKSVALREGTSVNGARVETATLADGDRIKLGSYELDFHLRQSVAPRVEASAQRPASASPGQAAGAQPAVPERGPVAAAATAGPCLVDGAGRCFPIRAGGPTTIGRALDNGIVVSDASVSRHHASIEAQDGGFRLRDLGSQNGTFIAGRRVAESALANGDSVRLGEAAFVFRA
jgi:pSer/pThr/pTyr-binding forkhead associated (FHA) protein